MSAGTHGAAAGVVLGIVAVLMGQQLGYYSLSDLTTALTDLLVGIGIGGILFGLIGAALGRRYRAKHPPVVVEGSPSTAPGEPE
jgi:hypothetical protein